MNGDNHDKGRFEGEVLARLTNIDKQQGEQWEQLSMVKQSVQDIKLSLATGKGVVMAVSAGLSAVVAFVVSKFAR